MSRIAGKALGGAIKGGAKLVEIEIKTKTEALCRQLPPPLTRH